MTTTQAFSEMQLQFATDLTQTFPDVPKPPVVDCPTFLKQLGPWATQMNAKDPAFFCSQNEFAKSWGLDEIWARPDCSDTTKQAIWQYLQSLYMIGTTMSMFPPETLSMIESVAENCAKNMKTNPNGQLDEASLMAGMNSMMAQLMSGNGGLAGLLGGAGGGAPQIGQGRKAQPRPGSRRPKK
jgi:hypothetical protein